MAAEPCTMPPGSHGKHISSAHVSESEDRKAEATVDGDKATPWQALFFFTTSTHIPIGAIGVTSSIIAGAATPAQSFLIGKLFNGLGSYAQGSLDTAHMMEYEKKYVMYLVAVAAISWLFRSLEFMAWLAFGELQAKSARDRLFHGLLDKDIEWYDLRKNGIAALLSRLQAQVRDLQLATAQPLGSIFSLGSTAVLSVIEALCFSWDLTLVTLATTPLILGFVIWLGNDMQRNIGTQTSKLSEAQKHVGNALSAIETVKCFNAQFIEHQKYMRRIREAAEPFNRVMHASGLQMAAVVLLSVSMFVQGFYYGGILVSAGKKTPGDIVTTFFAAVGAFQAIQSVLPQVVFLEKGRAAGATLRAVMAQVQQGASVQHTRGSLHPATCRGDIEVKNLSFAYPSRPDQLAIDDISMFIPNGEMTFLIGKSGSGKSTLGQILLRFYRTSLGEVLVDGVPIDSLNISWLRSNITLVEQQSLLFNDTVFQNIAFGKVDRSHVTKADVTEAAEFALLQLMINDMAEGLNTHVGYKGSSLSGGQRQRMALARARLRDTPILLLDECTSALDHISRTLMMDAIRQWRRGKTTVIITHDVSQILPDDYLYLLEHGKLVQEGYRKHLEKETDTPFQRFAPKEEMAASPSDTWQDTASKSIQTRGSLLELAYQGSQSGPRHQASDPLALQLQTNENERISLLSTMFNDGSPHTAMYGFSKTANIASPWIVMGWSPIAGTAATKEKKLSQPSAKSNTIHHSSRLEGEDNDRWSSLLQSLLDRTGNSAAASRSRNVGARVRHQAAERSRSGAMVKMGERSASDGSQDEYRQSPYGGRTTALSINQILQTAWPNVDWSARGMLLLGFWGASVHGVATPVLSFILSKLLETYAKPHGDKRMALTYSMAMLAIAITDSVHTYLFRSLLGFVGRRWVDNFRSKALERILDQPKSFFDEPENSVSKMADTLDRSAEEMVNILASFSGLIWIALLMCMVSIAWALVVSWKMTLISLAAAPYVLGVARVFAAVSGKWEARSNAASEAASAIFAEVFTNIKTVRALTLESHFLEKYVLATKHSLVVGFQRSFYSGFFYGLSDSATGFTEAMVFYVAARLVSSGTPVNDVIEVAVMLLFAVTNLSMILECIPQIGNSKDSASRLIRLATLPPKSHEHRGNTRIMAVGEIVFKDLQFAYPSRPKQMVLKDIDLCIRPGTTTAIVGGSGSGKSTLASLLLDMYSSTQLTAMDPRAGNDLTIAGRRISRISTPSLRTLIVPVAQTPTLFSATVAENISYGLDGRSPHNNMVSITRAAQQAGVHDFISSLPRGYSTMMGEGGIGVSGGQAQRIAIARALVRKPQVLILDEATSALDVESAALVRQTIKDVIDDKNRRMTVIIITHTRDMMEIAEKIVVMDRGTIVEEGGFDELMKKNGALSNLLSGGEWSGDRESQGRSSRDEGVPQFGDVDWSARGKNKRT